MRALRRMLALVLGLLCGLGAAHAQDEDDGGGPAGPVALDSPAWRDLTALPLCVGGKMNYHAAGLPAKWGRPAEAEAMRNHLLMLHGRALTEGRPSGTLADIAGKPAPSREAIQAAWNAGLQRAWGQITWPDTPPLGMADGTLGAPAAPGAWRLRAGGLGVHAQVRNRSQVVFALPGALELELRADGVQLVLSCTVRSLGGRKWFPGELAGLWCTSDRTAPAAALTALMASAPAWRMDLPADGHDWSAWIEGLAGGVPQDVTDLSRRRAHCRDQFNCRNGRLPTTEELQQARLRETPSEAKARREAGVREIRRERATMLWLGAGVLAWFAVYVLVARVMGTTIATGLSLVPVLFAAKWALDSVRGSVAATAALVPIIVLGAGVMLSFGFGWLYREFFERPKS